MPDTLYKSPPFSPAAITTFLGHLSAAAMKEVKKVMMLSRLIDLRWLSDVSLV
jgi:hypothetical protein